MNPWNNSAIFIYGNTSSFYSVSASSIQFSLQSLNATQQGFNIFTELSQLVLFKEKEV